MILMMKKFKFWLVWILVWLFWFVNFWNWFNFSVSMNDSIQYKNSTWVFSVYPVDWTIKVSNNPVSYVMDFSSYAYSYALNWGIWWSTNNPSITSWTYNVSCKDYPCYIKLLNRWVIDVFSWYVSCPECEICPEVNTWEILSWSCDTNYCVSNDLCPVSSWVSWSELVINDIVHESAPLINITIPEEYNWDSSVDENEFTLTISWQNVDYEYVDWIIRTQKFTPDSEDFNSIVTWVIPLLIPWLVIILFIWFIFRFIKKIF